MSLQIEDLAVSRLVAGSTSEQGSLRIRVLVADDQQLFRESLAGILDADPTFDVVGTAADGEEAIELSRHLRPDVVLMDVKMPRVDGITAIRRIKAELPQIRIILLTTFTSDGYVLEGLSAGANGYLLKDTSVIGLTSAIRAVYAGEQVTTPDVTARVTQLLEKQHAGKGQSSDSLTSREMETVILIARGMVAKEIARSLAISEKTVRNHISSIYRKLGIYDRSQVVIYAVKKGLIDLHEA